MTHGSLRPYLLISPSTALYAVFVAAPLVAILWLSLTAADGSGSVDLANYVAIVSDPYYIEIFARTLLIAVVTTVVTVSCGTWAALALFRLSPKWRSGLLLVCLAPLLISVIVRTMGWALLLGPTGLINVGLQRLGLIDQPMQFMYTITGVVVALVHVTVPYVVISVWASLERLPKGAELAAISLGASRMATLRRVTLPLAVPGILSGTLVVFAVAFGAFATPAIMGGGRLMTAATATYDEFLTTQNWPMGSALSVMLLLTCAVVVAGLSHLVEKRYALKR